MFDADCGFFMLGISELHNNRVIVDLYQQTDSDYLVSSFNK